MNRFAQRSRCVITRQAGTTRGNSMLVKRLSALLGVFCVLAASTVAGADGKPTASDSQEVQRPSATPVVALPRRAAVLPCIGDGYVPYSYPAFGTCPCGDNSCYDPARYYCGGKPYQKQWFRKWVRAHLGVGSMLDDVPCECRFPVSVRPYYRTVRSTKAVTETAPQFE